MHAPAAAPKVAEMNYVQAGSEPVGGICGAATRLHARRCMNMKVGTANHKVMHGSHARKRMQRRGRTPRRGHVSALAGAVFACFLTLFEVHDPPGSQARETGGQRMI